MVSNANQVKKHRERQGNAGNPIRRKVYLCSLGTTTLTFFFFFSPRAALGIFFRIKEKSGIMEELLENKIIIIKIYISEIVKK